jgi:PAS domain S-box-containing protein
MSGDMDKTQREKEQEIIFDSVPAWIFYKDKNNTFVRVNKSFCEAMGKTKSELEGRSLFDLYSKEEAEKFWQDDKEVIASGQSKKNILESIDSPKGKCWVSTDKIPYYDESGKIAGIVGFAFDITDRKNAEDNNQKSGLMLQNIIDLLPTRIFWKDLNLNYLGCNLAFAKDAGRTTTEEMIGKDDYQMAWKEQAELYRKDDMAVINSGVSKINYEEKQTTPNGNTLWLNTNKVPIKDKDGKIIGILGTYVDITDKKLAEDILRNALNETKEMNELMVGREIKMVELKNRIEQLENQLKKQL